VRRAVWLAILIAACSDSSSTGYGTKGIGGSGSSSSSGDDGTLKERDGGPLIGDDETPVTSPDDLDGDGALDADDCDPNSAALRKRIVQDDLATEKMLFGAATGFPAADWSFDAGYQQTRLADASDVSLELVSTDVGDVQIEVRGVSTEVGAITPHLRQIFVVAGAANNGGTFSAVACGIEVADGETPEQKTSIVKLAGAPTAVATTVLQRVTRPAVSVGEEFGIKMRLEDGAMTCDVTQGTTTTTVTTATANGLGAVRGGIGFFTRQTKARFTKVRACSLK